MFSVNIIAVGKLKEDYLRSACGEYLKRLSAFCKPTVIELPESRLPETPSEKQIAAALDSEGDSILKKISADDYVIAMCIEGRQYTSEKFSALLTEIPVRGKSSLDIIIGSSCGLSEKVKSAADLRLSMSEMTFPHQLARVMVLEQVYRGFMISSGKKYHK